MLIIALIVWLVTAVISLIYGFYLIQEDIYSSDMDYVVCVLVAFFLTPIIFFKFLQYSLGFLKRIRRSKLYD